MDTNTVTFDAFSHASSLQIENLNMIFTSEKLEKLDDLVITINNLTINDGEYELNTAIASNSQGDLTINPEKFTHTRNGILNKTLLSCRNIKEVSGLHSPKNPVTLAP